MKKLLFLFLIFCNLCKANHNYILKDTTVIHQISFSRGGNPGYDLQKEELEKRLLDHQKNPKSGIDAFQFLDSLKTKYEL